MRKSCSYRHGVVGPPGNGCMWQYERVQDPSPWPMLWQRLNSEFQIQINTNTSPQGPQLSRLRRNRSSIILHLNLSLPLIIEFSLRVVPDYFTHFFSSRGSQAPSAHMQRSIRHFLGAYQLSRYFRGVSTAPREPEVGHFHYEFSCSLLAHI